MSHREFVLALLLLLLPMGVTAQQASLSPDQSNEQIAADQIQPVPVIIRTTPAGATVYIDGVNAGTTDRNGVLTVFRAPDYYNLKVELTGYEAQELLAVIVSESGPNTFSFELVRNSGTLVLKTTQDNVYLYIDNRQVNQGRFELAPGSYRVKAEKDGFFSHEETIEVILGQIVERSIVLREVLGEIDLQINPVNAKWVIYKGPEISYYDTPSFQGSGNKKLNDLKQGNYTIVVELDGYVGAEKLLRIENEFSQLVSVTLQSNTIIRSRYPHMRFNIRNVGESITDDKSLAEVSLPPGEYLVEVFDYHGTITSNDTINVVSGEKGDFTLPKMTGFGSLEISSSPPDAKWSLTDDLGNVVAYGDGPKYLTGIQEGRYTISTELSGYRTQKNRIYLCRNTILKSHSVLNEGRTIPCPSTVRDASGNVYKTVMIGEQCWMAENLRTSKYRSGATIPNAITALVWNRLTYGAWANYDNHAENNATYGKLYNWYAVADARNICPAGWHVPSDAEWTVLSNHLGSDPGHKMKSTSGWDNNGNGSNASGFNALPGGRRYFDGTFNYVGRDGYFWSSTQDDTGNAWDRYLDNDSRGLFRVNSSYKGRGFSVRCLRD